jgi:hypothetical protein
MKTKIKINQKHNKLSIKLKQIKQIKQILIIIYNYNYLTKIF